MKLLLPAIILVVLVGTITVILSQVYIDSMDDVTQGKSTNMHAKDTKTMEEIVAMTCKQILEENIKGLQYFTKDHSEYIEQKIFECLRNEIPVGESYQLAKQKLKEASIKAQEQLRIEEIELLSLVRMNCDEIVQDTYNRANDHASSENRGFARDKVKECISKQDTMVRKLDCITVFILMKNPMEFYVEDTRFHLENRAEKCQADPAEMEMYQKFEECRASSKSFNFHDGICTIRE